ncbi:MAG: M3 family metallopeptidase [Tannerellaceae bacterium]|jgi:peptidyl-dipeptidase Dcp|nr:M3 family metallopeptidase [Tannerellaceae bacterium]
MKEKLVYLLLMISTVPAMSEENPFLVPYETPYGTPPFDRIETGHYEAAFAAGIREQALEVQAIVENAEGPTFGNTIEALERSGELLRKVSSAFYNVLHAEGDDGMMSLAESISPRLTESRNNIYLNEALFARVREVYGRRETLSLSSEERRLLEETYEGFERMGASLPAKDKERYRQLSEELSLLTVRFAQNALKDKNGYELLLTREDELTGLPESIREAASLQARSKGKAGWLFTLSGPSYQAFMRYSSHRSLREGCYRAYMSIGNKGDEYDNREIVVRIVNIRLEIARLLGFPHYAGYQLQRTMAKTPEAVYGLLEALLAAYRPVAEAEYRRVQEFAGGLEDQALTVMPWDWSYYSEKLKALRFGVNEEMTRPYFELNHVREKIFGLAGRLYGIRFRENKDIPVYHEEVSAYEVFDGDGSLLAILYTDFHPRQGKQSGAWMNEVKAQYREADGSDSRPQTIIVMNFSRATERLPSLLTFDEVNTFLHEFGHALHGMLTRCVYGSLSGTNVYHDFVELPSQLMENWLTEKEFLEELGVHYVTGERIPWEMVEQLREASRFNIGYACCRQLCFGLLDMAWHSLREPFAGEVRDFEKASWSKAQVLPEVPEAVMSSNFSHIFSGGYAAGYYGYKWSEVLEADAFSVFRARGIYDRETAASFRRNILTPGGTEDPAVLYGKYRGQEPSIEALLLKDGIKRGEGGEKKIP